MALNTKEREVLRRARMHIEENHTSFICHALNRVVSEQPELCSAVARLKLYINRELAPHTSLGFWQESQGIYKSYARQRLDRLAWIDWMLDESKEA